jgi:hypothetical protein
MDEKIFKNFPFWGLFWRVACQPRSGGHGERTHAHAKAQREHATRRIRQAREGKPSRYNLSTTKKEAAAWEGRRVEGSTAGPFDRLRAGKTGRGTQR